LIGSGRQKPDARRQTPDDGRRTTEDGRQTAEGGEESGSKRPTLNVQRPMSNAIQEAVRLLKAGGILAVKGVGGYHLCCDAMNDEAIVRLRERKHRPAKSLAVMFASLDQIHQYCEISAIEERELTGQAAPIVVVRRKPDDGLSRLLSPDTDDLGVFLPYAPLHHLLLAETSPLIMTSGNLAEEPIAKDEQELSAILGSVADAALSHNRAIVRRSDDSVLKIVAGQRLFLRRSRGIVPDAIRLPLEGPSVLACGAELKNTVCVTRGAQAFLSQHIGDLDDYRAYRFFRETVEDFSALLKVKPTIVAHDLHPDYLATRYALAQEGVRRIGVQHHHAHIAACMAEHGLTERVIGVALDGTGYGPDGTIWGGEFLVADLADFRRVGYFKSYRMPGGAEAIRQPTRMALSYGLAELTESDRRDLPALLPSLAENECRVLAGMIAQGVNAPWTSSAGRLFDAVAALLGLGEAITYEAQAAIRLQTLARPDGVLPYPYAIEIQTGGFQLSFGAAIRAIVADRRANVDRGHIAGGFHQTIAEAVGEMCIRIRDRERLEPASRLERVALSGGVFQNDLLLALTTNGLRRHGFQVYSHHLVPPNDGGIALGQAAVALARTDVRG
ncbi:MAG: carbamoyltransferase HypF, partial [Kiritimatiellae bacterium]|nr:carbamoyltransferase HypF [Kiritimatiellia bacterium]